MKKFPNLSKLCADFNEKFFENNLKNFTIQWGHKMTSLFVVTKPETRLVEISLYYYKSIMNEGFLKKIVINEIIHVLLCMRLSNCLHGEEFQGPIITTRLYGAGRRM